MSSRKITNVNALAILNLKILIDWMMSYFRNELHDDLFEKVSETRREAFDAIAKVRQKYGGSKGIIYTQFDIKGL